MGLIMWTNLLHGFLYMLVGTNAMVAPLQDDPDKFVASMEDWIPPTEAVLRPTLLTVIQKQMTGSSKQFSYLTIDSRDSEYPYVTTIVEGGVTNIITNYYQYAQQNMDSFWTQKEIEHGFQVDNWDWRRLYYMTNYSCVTPLLWGDGLYTEEALLDSIPGDGVVYEQVGMYPHEIRTNTYIVGYTNDTPIYQDFTNVVPRTLCNYNPVDQRPNAITPYMGLGHMEALDSKFEELLPWALDMTKVVDDSFNDYLASVSEVRTQYLGRIWFSAPGTDVQVITTEIYQVSGLTAAKYPEVDWQINTNYYSAGTEENYDFYTTSSVPGTVEEYDYVVISTSTISGTEEDYDWTEEEEESYSYQTNVPVSKIGGTGEVDYVKYVTNINYEVGDFGTVEEYDVVLTDSEPNPGTFQTNIIGTVLIEGAGPGGEVDAYPGGVPEDYDWKVMIGTNPATIEDYEWKVMVDTNPATAEDYDWKVVIGSNEVPEEVSDFHIEPTVYIWKDVENNLARYLIPWIKDPMSTYEEAYLYNLGWDPDYATGWRVWTEAPAGVKESVRSYWEYVYDYFKYVYDYFKGVYEYWKYGVGDPPWHYERGYDYYWLYERYVVTNEYRFDEEEITKSDTHMVTYYYKDEVLTNYFKYQIDYSLYDRYIETPLHQVVYDHYPIDTLPTYDSISNFVAVHPEFSGITQEVSVALSAEDFILRTDAYETIDWIKGMNHVRDKHLSIGLLDKVLVNSGNWLLTERVLLGYVAKDYTGFDYSLYLRTYTSKAYGYRMAKDPDWVKGQLDFYGQYCYRWRSALGYPWESYTVGPMIKIPGLTMEQGEFISVGFKDATFLPTAEELEELRWKFPYSLYPVSVYLVNPHVVIRPFEEE